MAIKGMDPRQNQFSPMAGQVKAQLEAVLAHPMFTRANRQSAFLRYIVECSLDGRIEDLKEHTIGVRVYGRRQEYDTREDPIVRVEAARLRAKLREYYEGPGAAQTLRFDLPKGTYVPKVLGLEAQPQPTPAPETKLPIAPPPLPASPALSDRFRWAVLALGLLIVVAAVWIVWTLREKGTLEPRAERSVAVLPFQDLSETQNQSMFCEGLTDQITDELARVNGLMVAGRTSASRFRDGNRDLRAIGEQLHVTHVLEGSVRAAGSRVRVIARLVDVQTGFQLWSATLEKNREDLFALQDEIARSMARALQVQLASHKESEAAARTPARLNAHNLFLEARTLHRKMNPTSLGEARRLHEAAVDADPSYALAHSGLAHVYVSLISSGLESATELRERAYAEARRAIELDPGQPDGYSALIRLARDIDYDWSSAQQICKDAEAFASNNPGIMANCGILDAIQQRFTEAEEHFQNAMRLDPLWPGVGEARANMLAWAGRLPDAEAQIRTVRRTSPEYIPAVYALGRILALQNRHDEALEVFDRFSTSGQSLSTGQLALMAYLSARAGNDLRAAAIERQLLARSRTERVLLCDLALVRLGLGDRAGAVSLLEQSLDNREPSLGDVITDPLFKDLRDQPGFRNLMRRLNL